MTLNKIAWTFSNTYFENIEKFNREVSEYQKMIYKTNEKWKPNEIVFDDSEIQIQYEAWITKPSDLLGNEFLIDEDKNVFKESVNEKEYHQVEIIAKLKTDKEKFTALELLMLIHNQQVNKELGDHVFFEGIDLNHPKKVNGILTYYIICGS